MKEIFASPLFSVDAGEGVVVLSINVMGERRWMRFVLAPEVVQTLITALTSALDSVGEGKVGATAEKGGT